MQLSPGLNAKLEALAKEFGELNLRSDEVPEAVKGLAEYLMSKGKGAIPIAVAMIANGFGLLYAESDGDVKLTTELFDIIANRTKEEAAK